MKKPQEVPSTEVMKTPGRFFDRASRGETFVVTRYGVPFVVLSPPPVPAAEPDKT